MGRSNQVNLPRLLGVTKVSLQLGVWRRLGPRYRIPIQINAGANVRVS